MPQKRYFDPRTGNETLFGLAKGTPRNVLLEKINLPSVIAMIFIAVIITWIISLFFGADTKIGPTASLFIYAIAVYGAFKAMGWMGTVATQPGSVARIVIMMMLVYIGLLVLLWQLPNIVPSLYSTVEIGQAIDTGLNSVINLG